MKSRLLPVLLLSLLCTTGARAQDEAAATTPRATPERAKEAAEAPAAPAPRTSTPPDDERFVPSEEISEDLSVSFPADI